jgi:transposase-like protein
MHAYKVKEVRMTKQTRASRRGYWQRIIQRQQASGLSIQRFCRRENLAMATFYHWKRRFREASAASEASATPAVRFAAVRVVPEASAAIHAGTIEIVLPGDRRVRLAGPVDRVVLGDVLAALEGKSSC